MADLERNVPCSTNTNFRLASVTKQFTAMAVLILSERGKLSLNDKLLKYFPEFPAYGHDITIRHLLTHTSGIIDYEDVMPAGLVIPLSDRDVLHLVCKQSKTYFTPGSDFRYSNSGYALLALLVEVVSGQKFAAFLKDNIFQPVGMANTVAYEATVSAVPNRALGYTKNGSTSDLSDQSLTSAVLGDGGIYSSVVDMAKWDAALYTDTLISRKLLEEAFTPHSKKSDFDKSGYGYGWYVGLSRDSKHIWHYGSTCGFSTKIERYPEKKLTVIVLSNLRNADLSVLTEKLVDLNW
jgi:CubicO group peptidase (beta-lactamase class C family)